jgi:hypothetical protein
VSHDFHLYGMLLALTAAGVVAGCGGASGHERLGDQAYGAGRWTEALAEYRMLPKTRVGAAVLAKTGAAALHAGELRQAAEAYARLAGEDPTRAEEAAEGLEGVARAAERGGNADVLREVMGLLDAIAPDRPAGHYALLLLQQPGLDSAEAAALLPEALASAATAGAVDTLLTRYGATLQLTAGCGQALLPYRAVLRRSRDSRMRAPASRGVADCAYTLGLRADSAGRLEDAALWFAESARVDSSSATGRRALLRYGGARLTQGDTLAAAIAFQAVASGGTADSTGQAAASRLASLAMPSSAGDSARTGVQ